MANGVTADPDEQTLTAESPLVPSAPSDQPQVFEKPPSRSDLPPRPLAVDASGHAVGRTAVPITPARANERYQQGMDRWNAEQMYEGQQAQLREINRQSESTFRQQGVATQRNPETGMVEPIRDESGNVVYHGGKGPVQYDETGKPFQVQRTAAGPSVVQLDKDAEIGPHDERPNELYKQNKYSPWEYLGTVQEGLQSSDRDVRNAAEKQQLAIDRRLHADTGNDLGRATAARALDLQNKVQDFRQNSGQLKALSDQLESFDQDHPGIKDTAGHWFTGGSQPTQEAKNLIQTKAKIQQEIDDLTSKGYSAIDPDKNPKDYDTAEKTFTAKERRILSEHGQDLKTWREMATSLREPGDLDKAVEERRAGLIAADRDPSQDPILSSLEKRKSDLGIGQPGQPAQDAQEAEYRQDPRFAPLLQERDQLDADHQAANDQLDQVEAEYRKRLQPFEQELNQRQNQIAPLRAEVNSLNQQLSRVDRSTSYGQARAQTIIDSLRPLSAELAQREAEMAPVSEAYNDLLDEAQKGWQAQHDQFESQLAPRRQDWQNRFDTAQSMKRASDHVNDAVLSDTVTPHDQVGKPALPFEDYQNALQQAWNPRNEQIKSDEFASLHYSVSQIVDSLFAPGSKYEHPILSPEVSSFAAQSFGLPGRLVASLLGAKAQTVEKATEESISKFLSGVSVENIASLPVFAIPGVAQVWAAGVVAKLPEQYGQIKDAIQQHGIFSKQTAGALIDNGITDAMAFFALKGPKAAEQTLAKAGPASMGDSATRVREAVANAKRNGITPEFRAFFGGIDPEIAGTTPEKVAEFAKSMGMEYTPVPKPEPEVPTAAPPDIGAVHQEIDNLQMAGRSPEEHVETQNVLRGLVKIAQGEPMDALTSVERAAVQAPTDDGTPRVEVIKGTPIITDTTLDRVRQIAPITAQIMPQSEEAQRQAIIHPETAAVGEAEPASAAVAQQPTFTVEVQNAKGETRTVDVQAADEKEAHAKIAQEIPAGQGLIRDVTKAYELGPAYVPPEQFVDHIVSQATSEGGRELKPKEEEAIRDLAGTIAPSYDRWSQAFDTVNATIRPKGTAGAAFKPGENALQISLPDLARTVRGFGDKPEAAGKLVTEEALHSVLTKIEDRDPTTGKARGPFDYVKFYDLMPQELKEAMLDVYKANDAPYAQAHEFWRMFFHGEIGLEPGRKIRLKDDVLHEQTSREFIQGVAKPMARVLRYVRDLYGELQRKGVSDEVISQVREGVNFARQKIKEVDAHAGEPITTTQGEIKAEQAPRPERPEQARGPPVSAAGVVEPERGGGEAIRPVTTPEVSGRGEVLPTGAEGAAREIEPAAGAQLAQSLNVPRGAIGHASQVTQGGRTLNVAYVAQEAAQSQTSHDAQGRVNPNYDQSLQPRDRSLPVYQRQSQNIARNLDFAQSAFFPNTQIPATTADLGAPIMTPEGHTIVGNGREIGINLAHQQGGPLSAKYKADFVRNARKFGIDPATVRSMANPVLKRVILDDVPKEDLVRFSQESNEPVSMGVNAIEVARRDASRLTPEHLSLLNPNYDLSSAKNAPFMRAFVRDVARGQLGANEANLTSAELANRVRSAIFTHAYGVDEAGRAAIERLAGEADPSGKTITNGLLTVAPIIARMRSDIQGGDLFKMDIAPALTRAAQDIATTLQNKPIAQPAKQALQGILDQPSLFSEDPLERAALEFMVRNRNKRSAIEEGLSNYVESVYQLGNPKQRDLFQEGGIATPLEIFNQATSDTAIARKEDRRILSAQRLQKHLSDLGIEEPKPLVELPAGKEVTISARTTDGAEVKIKMDARKAERFLERRENAFKALTDCLGRAA